MKMTTLYAALSGAFLLGAATLAPAQNVPSEPAKAAQPKSMENKAPGISGDEYKREKDRIEADAKSAKAKCQSLKDNAKDVCQAEAKATEKVAKKELDLRKNPNDKNRADLEKIKVEAAYEVAKEKCEDSKDAGQVASCKKQAKAEKDRAMAAAKGKKVADSGTSGTAARSGSTAGAGGSAAGTSSNPSGNISNTMSPSGREPSTNTNVRTQGTTTGSAGTGAAGSSSAVSSGTSGAADKKATKSGQ